MARHYPGGPRSSEVTKRLILDVAERICAEGGVESLTARTVSALADVNVASINYHFGSKQQLLEEMFRRRVKPLNQERLRQLDTALAGPRDELLKGVIRSFVGPVIRGVTADRSEGEQVSTGGNPSQVVTQFLARVYSMPGEEKFLEAHYEPVRSRFVLALQMCLPGLPLDDLLWRYNMMVGALIYAMAGPKRMTRRPLVFGSSDRPEDNDIEVSIERMAIFLTAGFEAPRVGGSPIQPPGVTPRPRTSRARS